MSRSKMTFTFLHNVPAKTHVSMLDANHLIPLRICENVLFITCEYRKRWHSVHLHIYNIEHQDFILFVLYMCLQIKRNRKHRNVNLVLFVGEIGRCVLFRLNIGKSGLSRIIRITISNSKVSRSGCMLILLVTRLSRSK